MRVYVAEDDPGIFDVMQIILSERGHTVKSVESVDAIEKEIGEFQPDVILLDISLYGRDGAVIARKLKAGQSKSIPLIILSANPETREISEKVGADTFLSKPFDLEDLIQVVEKYK